VPHNKLASRFTDAAFRLLVGHFVLTRLEAVISLNKKLRGARLTDSPHHHELTADYPAGIKEEMILTSANGIHKPERFDLYVGKLRSLFDMHGIGIGSPDNLPTLLQRLEEDRRFSMEFWGLVGKLSSREGGELSDEQTLTVVVAGVTGDESLNVADTRLRHSLDQLRALLSGVDLHQEPLTPTRAIAAMQQANFRTPRSSLEPSFVSQESPSHSTTQPGALQTQLEQTIQRLEQVNQQLVQSLSYLDERFRRLESHFELSSRPPIAAENVAPHAPERSPEPAPDKTQPLPPSNPETSSVPLPADPPIVAIEEEPVLDTVPIAETAPIAPPVVKPRQDTPELIHKAEAAKPRLVLEPVPAPDSAPFPPQTSKPHDGPLFEYASSSSESTGSGKKAAAGLALVLLLAGSGFAWFRYGTQIRQKATDLIHGSHPAETPPAPTPQQSDETTPADTGNQPAQPAARAEQTAAPPAADASTPQPAPEQPHVAPPPAPQHTTATTPPDTSNSWPASAVKVPPAVMEKNLLVSRVPAYPEAAKASRVQGSVIVQALITKTGAVSRLRVVQGDTRLRTAALDAIYRQRYRPYLVNGVPVDVVTTISMSFTPGQ
jgi:TonB family protein